MTRSRQRTFWEATEISALFVGVLFFIEFLDFVLPVQLDYFGIVPRVPLGLIGVLFAPVLHVNTAHLMANAFPLFILLVLLFWDRRYYPDQALASIWIASGLGTWLIGRGGTIHVGASLIVYGLVVYLIAAGWWIRSWRAVIVALLIAVFYGGIVFGMLPQRGEISWEGHLAGAIAGWWVAWRKHA